MELVIFNNLAIDLLLELSTLTVFRRKPKWARVLLGAALGAGVATAYPLCSAVWQIVIRVVLAPVMALVFDSFTDEKYDKNNHAKNKVTIRRNILAYVKRLAVFCLLTYCVGGVSFGINFLFGIDVASYWQLGVVALGLLTLLITLRIFLLKRSKNARKLCDVKVCAKSGEMPFKALCDSGNTLTDDLSGLPVVIISSSAEKSLAISDEHIEGFISVKTINGEGSMPIVRLDGVEVAGRKYVCYGALSRRDFDGVEIILQNTMF